MIKNPPADAGDMRDVGLVPGWGRCPGGWHGNLLWKIPWTKEHGGLQSKESDMNGKLGTHAQGELNQQNEMKRNVLLAAMQRKELGAVGCNVGPGRKCHIQ